VGGRPERLEALLEGAVEGGRLAAEQGRPSVDERRLSAEEALDLYVQADFHALGRAADAVRRARFPEGYATFVIDRNVNTTSVCVTGCRFCAYYHSPQDPGAWRRSVEEIHSRVEEAVAAGATQIMFQGGHDPERGLEWYEGLLRGVRAKWPGLTLHCLGPSEIAYFARTSGLPVTEVLSRLRSAGLDSLPGAGAEILVDRVRRIISPLKEPAEVWLEVMRTAHGMGIESTATMMMGTVETPAERIEHLRVIRELQDEAGGFRAFIPWTYQAGNNVLGGRTNVTVFDYLRFVAVARLYLDNVAHVQGSWLTAGKDAGQLSLHLGADDLGSVMLEENVVAAAGTHNSSDVGELVHLIRQAGRIPVQRDTLYRALAVYDAPDGGSRVPKEPEPIGAQRRGRERDPG